MRVPFPVRLVLLLGIVGAVAYPVVGPPIRSAVSPVRLPPPSAYPRHSELCYLAWIQHGTFGQRGGAAQALLSLPNRREYETTRRVRLLEQQRSSFFGDHEGDRVIDHMLLIALFDLRPAEYHRELEALVRRDPRDAEDIWVKTGEVFEGETMDFHFGPALEASFRLFKNGYADRGSVRVVLSAATSYYPIDRERAAAVFHLFPGLPPYDPAPQPKTINDLPDKTAKQAGKIGKWFDEHLDDLRWSAQEKRYVHSAR